VEKWSTSFVTQKTATGVDTTKRNFNEKLTDQRSFKSLQTVLNG